MWLSSSSTVIGNERIFFQLIYFESVFIIAQAPTSSSRTSFPSMWPSSSSTVIGIREDLKFSCTVRFEKDDFLSKRKFTLNMHLLVITEQAPGGASRPPSALYSKALLFSLYLILVLTSNNLPPLYFASSNIHH